MVGLEDEEEWEGVEVNVIRQVSIVLTQHAARFVGELAKNNPDMVEPMEVVVEEALELCSESHVVQVVFIGGSG